MSGNGIPTIEEPEEGEHTPLENRLWIVVPVLYVIAAAVYVIVAV